MQISSIEFSMPRLPNIYGSLSLYDLHLQHKYRVSSIEHKSGIVRYRRNDCIVPAISSSPSSCSSFHRQLYHVTTIRETCISCQHLYVLCNHCMITEYMLIIVCFVMYAMQEPQGEQCCALMGYPWVNMT